LLTADTERQSTFLRNDRIVKKQSVINYNLAKGNNGTAVNMLTMQRAGGI